MLKKITLAHGPLFKDLTLELGQITLITGENATGKTNLLTAITRAFQSIPHYRLYGIIDNSSNISHHPRV